MKKPHQQTLKKGEIDKLRGQYLSLYKLHQNGNLYLEGITSLILIPNKQCRGDMTK